MVKKFIRRGWYRYSKLGLRKKKKQIWRRPTGRHNKMREKKRGFPPVVSIGYGKDRKIKNKIENKKLVRIMNAKELLKVKNDEYVIIGKIGNKKKIEIAKLVKDKKIKILNLNIKKFLKKIEKPIQEGKEGKK